MPGYRRHLAGATLFAGAYLAALAALYGVDASPAGLSLPELVVYSVALFGICLMFGIWPDVDTNSLGRKVFYSLFIVVDVVLIATRQFEEAAYLGLFALLPAVSKHRGWTHTKWAMLLVPSPLLIVPGILFPDRMLSGLPFYGAAVVGYFSHLCIDGKIFSLKRRR